MNGSCTNSVSVDDAIWERLATVPPVPLTQSYYECYNTIDAALLNAAGVATGNASIAMLVLMIALLPLIYTLLAIFHQVPEPSEYSERQRAIALDTFSTALLRTRDHRLVKHHPVLQDLFYDLIEVMQEDENNVNATPSAVPRDIEAGVTESHHASRDPHGTHDQAAFGRARMRKNGLAVHDPGADYDALGTADEVLAHHHPSFKPFALETLGMIVAENVSPENGLRVLNSPGNKTSGNETTSSVDNIVLKMLYCFGKALIEKEKHDSQKHVGIQHLLGEETKASDGSSNLDDTAVQVAREEVKCEDSIASYSSSFVEGHQAAMELISVNLTNLLEREDNLTVFVRLANALCMQASLELNMDMKEIANSTMSEKIAYNIGGQIFTYAAIIIQSMAHRV